MIRFNKKLNIPAKNYVEPSSRYIKSKVIQYTENKYITFEIYKRKPSPPISQEDQWVEITPEVEYRPDLVATEFYGSPDFWWRILEFNDIKDILEFKAGRNIRLPGDILW